ncbi:DoxX family protein [Methyloversatilis thermotolerans]|uniref:DoxX family protein n=1 Tax=Methyloversatilis thermotolerans TaxID=1346290 RepID=UPI0003644025|nr:DoxX family protein [Methyloversatilis thermotolerans]
MNTTALPPPQTGSTDRTVAARSVAAAAGRVLLAAIFLLSGFSKIAQPEGTIGYIASAGLPFPELAFAAALFVEIGLAAALVVGYRTRLVAGAIAAFSLATAFGFHFNLADQNQFIHFFKNVAIAGGLLQIVAFGGGALSLDARRQA